MESMTVVAILTADWKPNVVSVPQRSLSMVLGSVTTWIPCCASRLAVLCVPVAAQDHQAVEARLFAGLQHLFELGLLVLVGFLLQSS